MLLKDSYELPSVLKLCRCLGRAKEPSKEFLKWAATPPMGWNSWDCFGAAVTEEQVRANADYMAEHLLKHGWQYIVVDIQWYEPESKGHNYRKDAKLSMDQFSRLVPAPDTPPKATAM